MDNFKKKPLTKTEIIALSYYSRKEIQKTIFDFCKHRETVANFNNKFFAKRPDTFDYQQDILNQAKKGATSFHCSEELWHNPLDIKTNMTPRQYNEIRSGWDFLIDIDSPFLDYGKIAAKLIIRTLESHGIKNFGIKFSGGKGFHIIIPFKAFPKEINGEQTKDNFPEWPRLIADYIFKQIREPMNREILNLTSREKLKEKGELVTEYLCPKCGNPTEMKKIGKYRCQDIRCKTEIEHMKSNREFIICPTCNGKAIRISEREIQFCKSCKTSTAKLEATSSFGGEIRKNKTKQFKIEETIKSTEDALDVVLVSSRHLFRAPYSLHEKTAFASIVIDKSQIQNFKPSDADPLKIVQPKSFMPNVEQDEAKELLLKALSWGGGNKPKEQIKKYEGGSVDISGLIITEKMYPPIINKILKGMQKDGRKRALGLLLSFFTFLEFPQDFIKEKIEEWNNKNYQPLKQGYIKSQVAWSIKNKRLPPNYDKPIYKEFGIKNPPEPGMKNPINYTIKKAIQSKSKKSEPFYVKLKKSREI